MQLKFQVEVEMQWWKYGGWRDITAW